MAKGGAVATLGVVVVGLLMGCAGGAPETDNNQSSGPRLPQEVMGWRTVDEGEVYDTESIYSYIDGHAEVYMAYGMVRCLSRRFSAPEGEPDIVLDLFEQASTADAFGVFTHDREGDEVAIGQGGVFRHGWLSFWKGRWYGSVYAEGESPSSAEAVLAIGRAVAGAIEEVGDLPQLVAELPSPGLEPRSVRFLHTQGILNTAVYVGSENFLGLDRDTDAALGRYRFEEGGAWLLLVDYPNEDSAVRAEAGARAKDLGVLRTDLRLAVVLEPESDEITEILLQNSLEEGS